MAVQSSLRSGPSIQPLLPPASTPNPVRALQRIHLLPSAALVLVPFLLFIPHLRHRVIDPHRPWDIQKLTSMPEDSIDIGLAALNLDKEFNPGLDVAAYSRMIDDLVKDVLVGVNGSTDPNTQIQVMNVVLFLKGRFRYAFDGIRHNSNDPYLLSYLLDTKKGYCFTLPMLYMAVAQRAGFPVYAVHVPRHIFLRYVFPVSGRYINIEATAAGQYFPDETYIKDFHITPEAIKKGAYLRTMSNREYMAVLLRSNAQYYLDQGRFEKAIPRLEEAIELNPHYVDSYGDLGFSHQALCIFCKGEEAIDHFKKGEKFREIGKELRAGTPK